MQLANFLLRDRHSRIYLCSQKTTLAGSYATAYAKVRVDGRRAFAVLAEEGAWIADQR